MQSHLDFQMDSQRKERKVDPQRPGSREGDEQANTWDGSLKIPIDRQLEFPGDGPMCSKNKYVIMAILPGTKVGHLTQRLGTILGKTTLFLVAPNYIIAFGLKTVNANSDNVPTFSTSQKTSFYTV